MNTILALGVVLITHINIWCTTESEIEAFLKKDGRELVAVAMSGPDTVRLYVNAENRKWALVSISPRDEACVLGSGNNFDLVRQALGDEDA
jgi:hypothetical protein